MSGIFDRWVKKKKTTPDAVPYQPQEYLTGYNPQPTVPGGTAKRAVSTAKTGKPWWYWLLMLLACIAVVPIIIILVQRWRKSKK
jgi:hypothetical protein